jgi:DNA-binding transcriptional ArsR family regulator
MIPPQPRRARLHVSPAAGVPPEAKDTAGVAVGLTLGELEAVVPELTRFGVMKHLAVLEQAGLVVTRKQGRHKHHHLNPIPLRLVYERWIDKYRDRGASALLDLKDHVEART